MSLTLAALQILLFKENTFHLFNSRPFKVAYYNFKSTTLVTLWLLYFKHTVVVYK